MASKSYGWDVRNIAKISPKMAKKQPFFDFFRFSQKLSNRFERNFLQSFYIILESYMCNGIKIVWLGSEKHSRNYPKNGQMTIKYVICFSVFESVSGPFITHAALVFRCSFKGFFRYPFIHSFIHLLLCYMVPSVMIIFISKNRFFPRKFSAKQMTNEVKLFQNTLLNQFLGIYN